MTQVLAARERPIIFGAAMIQALLAGRKTQTRRVLGPQPCSTQLWGHGVPRSLPDRFCVHARWPDESDPKLRHFDTGDPWLPCPYGKPGDRLWVREAWRSHRTLDTKQPAQIAASALAAGYKQPWAPLQYEADGARTCWSCWHDPTRDDGSDPAGRLRSPLHMPRWASRILLEITEIRVERVQFISSRDVRAEGIEDSPEWCDGTFQHDADNLSCFEMLWDTIHAKDGHGWESNPWVWAVSFRMLERRQVLAAAPSVPLTTAHEEAPQARRA